MLLESARAGAPLSRSGRSGRPLQAAGKPRLAEDGAQGVEALWNQAVPHPQAALVTLDQTGTVTTGRMALVDVVPVGATTVDEVLRLVGDAVGERLRSLGLEPILLTGDNERAARAVADRVGIDTAFAEVLPSDKVEVVRGLQRD